MSDMEEETHLGFTYRATKNGMVMISRHGKVVTHLSADTGREFLVEVENASFSEQQMLMARVTGNYKHGNERLAASHPRNRR